MCSPDSINCGNKLPQFKPFGIPCASKIDANSQIMTRGSIERVELAVVGSPYLTTHPLNTRFGHAIVGVSRKGGRQNATGSE